VGVAIQDLSEVVNLKLFFPAMAIFSSATPDTTIRIFFIVFSCPWMADLELVEVLP